MPSTFKVTPVKEWPGDNRVRVVIDRPGEEAKSHTQDARELIQAVATAAGLDVTIEGDRDA